MKPLLCFGKIRGSRITGVYACGMRHLPCGQAVNGKTRTEKWIDLSPHRWGQIVLTQPRRGVPDRREGFCTLSLSGHKGMNYPKILVDISETQVYILY